jgi:hypothetical protein
MSPDRTISRQQYKTPGPLMPGEKNMYYIFMALGEANDQVVFHIINDLAKRCRETQPEFYRMVREIRANMTRVKLAAEHDMATNFSLANPGFHDDGRPKFRFSLISKTDLSLSDAKFLNQEQRTALEQTKSRTKPQGGSIQLQPTPPGLLEARRNAGLDYQSLVLNKLRYGEVTVAYRHHAGIFPIYTEWDSDKKKFKVLKLDGKVLVPKTPEEWIADKPV